MIKFTKEEISLCKQVAEKWRKPIKIGDWIIPKSYDGKPSIILRIYENTPLHYFFTPFDNTGEEYILGYLEVDFPLWTISDCLEFFEKRDYQVEIKRVADSWFIEIWKIGHKAESIKEWIAKLLEACLKAVIEVLKLKEGK